MREKREEYLEDVDIQRLAADLVVDAVSWRQKTCASELLASTALRRAPRPRRSPQRRRAIPPV